MNQAHHIYRRAHNARAWELKIAKESRVGPKKTHEQIEADVARFLAGGGEVTQLPTFGGTPTMRVTVPYRSLSGFTVG